MAPRAQPVLGHPTASCDTSRWSSRRNAWQPWLPADLSPSLKPSHHNTEIEHDAGLVDAAAVSPLPRTASTPFVLDPSGLRALRVDPAPRSRHASCSRPTENSTQQGVDGPTPFRNAVLVVAGVGA